MYFEVMCNTRQSYCNNAAMTMQSCRLRVPFITKASFRLGAGQAHTGPDGPLLFEFFLPQLNPCNQLDHYGHCFLG